MKISVGDRLYEIDKALTLAEQQVAASEMSVKACIAKEQAASRAYFEAMLKQSPSAWRLSRLGYLRRARTRRAMVSLARDRRDLVAARRAWTYWHVGLQGVPRDIMLKQTMKCGNEDEIAAEARRAEDGW